MLYQSGSYLSRGSVGVAVIDGLFSLLGVERVDVGLCFLLILDENGHLGGKVGDLEAVDIDDVALVVDDIVAPVVVDALGAPVLVGAYAIIDDIQFKNARAEIIFPLDDDFGFVGFVNHVVG